MGRCLPKKTKIINDNKMRTSAFILLLSLVANLSFGSLTSDSIPVGKISEQFNSCSRDGLNICLVGDWMNIGEAPQVNGFASLSMYGSGKFEGLDANGKRVCGTYEISRDNLTLVFHKICEKTGVDLGTLITKIEMVDGHMLSLNLPEEMGGKQVFIQ
jgi:hypothetical protein